MRREIDGAAAARQRRIEHPAVAGRAIALREARDEAERHVLDGLLRAQQLEEIAVAEDQRHGREGAGLLGGLRDAGDFACVQAAGLFQRERDFLGDEEARRVGHVAMAAERNDEVGLHAGAQLAEVGVAGAAELRLQGIDGLRVGIGDARDGHARHLQGRLQIERQVPVR